jgi:hypothetical protein
MQKGKFYESLENFRIQQWHHLELLIDKQPQQEQKPLYTLGHVLRQLAIHHTDRQ